MAEARGGVLPGGFRPEILKCDIDNKYLCVICNLLLRDPRQGGCGHRFCKGCIRHLLQENGKNDVYCPGCIVEDTICELSLLDAHKIFPDNALKREFAGLQVYCINDGCDWKGSFKYYENHLKACPWVTLACEHCGKEMARTQIEAHQNLGEGDCPGPLLQCPFGCGQEIRMRERDAHYNEHVPLHLHRVLDRTEQLERNHDSANRRNIEDFTNETSELQSQLQAARSTSERLREETFTDHTNLQNKLQRIEIAEGALKLMEALVPIMQGEINSLSGDREQLGKLKGRAEYLEQRIVSTETSSRIHSDSLVGIKKRVEALQYTSNDGTFIWQITDVQQKQEAAILGTLTSHYSPFFYTGNYGYKACMRLYPNGDGQALGSHVSLFLTICRGPYDAILSWPFYKRVTFTLLNQGSQHHIVESFMPDVKSSSFHRPTTDMNLASGFPKFVALNVLSNPNQSFVKDDCAYIKVEIE